MNATLNGKLLLRIKLKKNHLQIWNERLIRIKFKNSCIDTMEIWNEKLRIYFRKCKALKQYKFEIIFSL